MSIFTIFISFFIGWLVPGLSIGNYSSAQSNALDIERKNDINAIYQKLEVYYNENGDYPTSDKLVYKTIETLPGLDEESLRDPGGVFINQNGDYLYEPVDCTALGCAQYTLSAKLGDGTEYTKLSLN